MFARNLANIKYCKLSNQCPLKERIHKSALMQTKHIADIEHNLQIYNCKYVTDTHFRYKTTKSQQNIQSNSYAVHT